MNVGMLWFDNDSKTDLVTKIDRAVDYYHDKYGKEPNLCFVHPSMVSEAPPKGSLIKVKTSRSVLPNHFWLGESKNGNRVKMSA
jgi:hypothetical protein